LSTGLQTSGSLFRVAVRLRDQGTPAKEDVKDFYINVTAINFKPVMDNEVATLQEGTQTGASVAVMSASDPPPHAHPHIANANHHPLTAADWV